MPPNLKMTIMTEDPHQGQGGPCWPCENYKLPVYTFPQGTPAYNYCEIYDAISQGDWVQWELYNADTGAQISQGDWQINCDPALYDFICAWISFTPDPGTYYVKIYYDTGTEWWTLGQSQNFVVTAAPLHGTYYFDSKSTSVWTDSEKMIDDILTNYAATSSDGDTEVLDGNTCPGIDLGTIFKVEIRVYGHGDGDDRIDLTPIFGGVDGDTYQTTPSTVPDWGGYQDITTDTSAPSPWSWSDIQNLDCKVVFEKVAKANIMYCAKVEVRVTFAPPLMCEDYTNQIDCEAAGCYWYNGSCHTSPPTCEELLNEFDCTRYGCYWYDGACHLPLICEDYTDKTDCEAAGCFWWNAACHDLAPSCEALLNKFDCTRYGCYWYNGSCHTSLPTCEELNNEPDCLRYYCFWYDGACHSAVVCESILIQTECEAHGCYWWNGACHTATPSCEELLNEPDCLGYGCFWYNGACHSAIVCENILVQTECEAHGCYWYDGNCHTYPPPPLCEDYTNQIDCEAHGCYWWNSACHDLLEGDYIDSWELNAENINPYGITTDGTNIWVVDGGTVVYRYDMAGNYIDSWSLTAANASPTGITTDGTNIWVVDYFDEVVYKYDMAGNYIDSWGLTAANIYPYGITTNGMNIWVVGGAVVYKYNMSGGYIDSWALTAENVDPRGITTDGTNIWVVNDSPDAVYKYNMSGGYIDSWVLTGANTVPLGIATDGTNIWVVDLVDEVVYKYGGPPPLICENYTNQIDCEAAGCYWYDGACHSTVCMDLCVWLADHGMSLADYRAPLDITITDVFTIVDSYLSEIPPGGYTFVPTLQNVFGVIDYYLGFDGDPLTGCDFYP